ncbi:hypothetical protein BpHYR1_042023 [Brachionus plicatilis]|uniref:Uncharacterized protein n=1 Tax=Brachionus plicatilis TaxID=10195 RepID=A0A3M7PUA0_BRAPC|nr:hypothetical protein BpHYR1_042023 [Brachionus plicatilis]
MTKIPIEKNTSNKENDLWNELNGHQAKLKNRRTLSFMNTNRRRISHFGTLKNSLKNRRLSLSQPSKKFIQLANASKANSENFLSLTSIKNQFRKYTEVPKDKEQSENKAAFKKLSFKTNKQKQLASEFNFETLFSHDKNLSDYLKKHFNSKNLVLVSNI